MSDQTLSLVNPRAKLEDTFTPPLLYQLLLQQARLQLPADTQPQWLATSQPQVSELAALSQPVAVPAPNVVDMLQAPVIDNIDTPDKSTLAATDQFTPSETAPYSPFDLLTQLPAEVGKNLFNWAANVGATVIPTSAQAVADAREPIGDKISRVWDNYVRYDELPGVSPAYRGLYNWLSKSNSPVLQSGADALGRMAGMPPSAGIPEAAQLMEAPPIKHAPVTQEDYNIARMNRELIDSVKFDRPEGYEQFDYDKMYGGLTPEQAATPGLVEKIYIAKVGDFLAGLVRVGSLYGAHQAAWAKVAGAELPTGALKYATTAQKLQNLSTGAAAWWSLGAFDRFTQTSGDVDKKIAAVVGDSPETTLKQIGMSVANMSDDAAFSFATKNIWAAVPIALAVTAVADKYMGGTDTWKEAFANSLIPVISHTQKLSQANKDIAIDKAKFELGIKLTKKFVDEALSRQTKGDVDIKGTDSLYAATYAFLGMPRGADPKVFADAKKNDVALINRLAAQLGVPIAERQEFKTNFAADLDAIVVKGSKALQSELSGIREIIFNKVEPSDKSRFMLADLFEDNPNVIKSLPANGKFEDYVNLIEKRMSSFNKNLPYGSRIKQQELEFMRKQYRDVASDGIMTRQEFAEAVSKIGEVNNARLVESNFSEMFDYGIGKEIDGANRRGLLFATDGKNVIQSDEHTSMSDFGGPSLGWCRVFDIMHEGGKWLYLEEVQEDVVRRVTGTLSEELKKEEAKFRASKARKVMILYFRGHTESFTSNNYPKSYPPDVSSILVQKLDDGGLKVKLAMHGKNFDYIGEPIIAKSLSDPVVRQAIAKDMMNSTEASKKQSMLFTTEEAARSFLIRSAAKYAAENGYAGIMLPTAETKQKLDPNGAPEAYGKVLIPLATDIHKKFGSEAREVEIVSDVLAADDATLLRHTAVAFPTNDTIKNTPTATFQKSVAEDLYPGISVEHKVKVGEAISEIRRLTGAAEKDLDVIADMHRPFLGQDENGNIVGQTRLSDGARDVIALAANGFTEGTISHEAYHWLEFRKLEQAEVAILANRFGDAEARANAFEQWRRGELDETPNTTVGKIFSKLEGFIERLHNLFSGLGYKNADDIFDDIYSGRVGQRAIKSEFGAVDIALNKIKEGGLPPNYDLINKADAILKGADKPSAPIDDTTIEGQVNKVIATEDITQLNKLMKKLQKHYDKSSSVDKKMLLKSEMLKVQVNIDMLKEQQPDIKQPVVKPITEPTKEELIAPTSEESIEDIIDKTEQITSQVSDTPPPELLAETSKPPKVVAKPKPKVRESEPDEIIEPIELSVGPTLPSYRGRAESSMTLEEIRAANTPIRTDAIVLKTKEFNDLFKSVNTAIDSDKTTYQQLERLAKAVDKMEKAHKYEIQAEAENAGYPDKLNATGELLFRINRKVHVMNLDLPKDKQHSVFSFPDADMSPEVKQQVDAIRSRSSESLKALAAERKAKRQAERKAKQQAKLKAQVVEETKKLEPAKDTPRPAEVIAEAVATTPEVKPASQVLIDMLRDTEPVPDAAPTKFGEAPLAVAPPRASEELIGGLTTPEPAQARPGEKAAFITKQPPTTAGDILNVKPTSDVLDDVVIAPVAAESPTPIDTMLKQALAVARQAQFGETQTNLTIKQICDDVRISMTNKLEAEKQGKTETAAGKAPITPSKEPKLSLSAIQSAAWSAEESVKQAHKDLAKIKSQQERDALVDEVAAAFRAKLEARLHPKPAQPAQPAQATPLTPKQARRQARQQARQAAAQQTATQQTATQQNVGQQAGAAGVPPTPASPAAATAGQPPASPRQMHDTVEAIHQKAIKQEIEATKLTPSWMYRAVTSALIDQSFALEGALKRLGRQGKLVQRLFDLSRGGGGGVVVASRATRLIFQGVNERGVKVYEPMTKQERETFCKVLDSMAQIQKARQATDRGDSYTLAGNTTVEQHKAYLAVKRANGELNQRVEDALNVYFDVMSKSIMDRVYSGLISTEAATVLMQNIYSPRLNIEYVDKDAYAELMRKGRSISTETSGLKELDEGTEALASHNAERLLNVYIATAYSLIGRNEPSKAMFALSFSDQASDVVKPAYAVPSAPATGWTSTANGKAGRFLVDVSTLGAQLDRPEGYTEFRCRIHGQEYKYYMKNWAAKQFNTNPVILPSTISNAFGIATLTRGIKMLLTSKNPAFPFVNEVQDSFTGLFSSGLYSKDLATAILQLNSDMKVVKSDAKQEAGVWFDNYAKYGGMMEFLAANLAEFKTMPADSKANKFSNLVSKPGKTAEILVRLALMRRSLINKGYTDEAVQAGSVRAEDMVEAVHEARNYVDFSKGGWFVKVADSITMFLNPSVQLARANVRSMTHEQFYTYMAESAAALVGVAIWNGAEPEYDEQIKDDPAYGNFVVVRMPFGKFTDAQGNNRFMSLKIPASTPIIFMQSLIDYVLHKTDVKSGGYKKGQLVKAAEGLVSFMREDRFQIPIATLYSIAVHGEYRGRKAPFRQAQNKTLEYDENTHQAFVDLGNNISSIAGVGSPVSSPFRLQSAASLAFPQSNGIIGAISVMGDNLYKMAFDTIDAPQMVQEQLSKWPLVRSYFSVSNPKYTFKSEAEEAFGLSQNEEAVVRHKLDKLFAEHKIGRTSDSQYAAAAGAMAKQYPDRAVEIMTEVTNAIEDKQIGYSKTWITSLKRLSPEDRAYIAADKILKIKDTDERNKLIKELSDKDGKFMHTLSTIEKTYEMFSQQSQP